MNLQSGWSKVARQKSFHRWIKASLIFFLGLAVGIQFQSMKGNSHPLDRPTDRTEGQVNNEVSSFADRTKIISAITPRRTSSPPSSTERLAAKATLFDYAFLDPNLQRGLADLSDEQAGQLAAKLAEYEAAFREHEQTAAIVESQGKNTAVIVIPALSPDGAFAEQIKMELNAILAGSTDDAFLASLGSELSPRFSDWGRTEQRISVEFEDESAHVEQVMKSVSRSATFGRDYRRDDERFKWLFDLLNRP